MGASRSVSTAALAVGASSPEGSWAQVQPGSGTESATGTPALCLALAAGCAWLPRGRISPFSPFPHCLCGTGTCFVPQIVLESQPCRSTACRRRDKGAEGVTLVLKGCPGKGMGTGTGPDAILELWRLLLPPTGRIKSLGWVQQPGICQLCLSPQLPPCSAEGMVLQAEDEELV